MSSNWHRHYRYVLMCLCCMFQGSEQNVFLITTAFVHNHSKHGRTFVLPSVSVSWYIFHNGSCITHDCTSCVAHKFSYSFLRCSMLLQVTGSEKKVNHICVHYSI